METLQRADERSWLTVADIDPTIEVQATQQAHEMVGELVLRDSVEVEFVPEGIDGQTLLFMIRQAKAGDGEALQFVKTCVGTDLAERLFKSANETEVPLQVNESGDLVQGASSLIGLPLDTIQNTYLNSTMYERTFTELINPIIFGELQRRGIFDTHYAAVFSPTTTDEETKHQYKFFTKTDTLAVQLTGQDDGEFFLKSAFVAGKQSPEGERNDLSAIMQLLALKGITVDFDPTNPLSAEDQMLSKIVLIPKADLPLGVTSLVQQYDDQNGTFYGEAMPRQDYAAYAEECRQRDFSELVDQITDRLLAEVDSFTMPIHANKRLDELAGEFGVQYAVDNPLIDADIFGKHASKDIEQARFYNAIGDIDRAKEFILSAVLTQESISCPWAVLEAMGMTGAGSDEYGSLEFDCPSCKSKNTRSSGKLKDNCDHCQSSVQCG